MSERSSRPRSAHGAALCRALREGNFELPCCTNCGATQYPPRDICRICLSDEIEIRECDRGGRVIASTMVYRSLANDFELGGPWPIASIAMDAGPTVFAHVLNVLPGGTEVSLVALKDGLGDGVLGALAEGQDFLELQAKF